ncbi:pentapeptide repeat-containing protein [Candidatus Babeliales bacterium]|nr:pentapeptide repeat-containing protein [Candidatus Babeliales bacterium]
MKKLIRIFIFISFLPLQSYNPQHVQALQKAVKNKKIVNCSKCDFRGVGNLFKGLKLKGAQLSGAMFSKVVQATNPKPILIEILGQNCDLSGVDFFNATLVSTSFDGANLSNANFYGADVAYANFAGADLTGAKLDGAINCKLALFCGAIMPDGTKPTGLTWTSKKGKIFYMHCAL